MTFFMPRSIPGCDALLLLIAMKGAGIYLVRHATFYVTASKEPSSACGFTLRLLKAARSPTVLSPAAIWERVEPGVGFLSARNRRNGRILQALVIAQNKCSWAALPATGMSFLGEIGSWAITDSHCNGQFSTPLGRPGTVARLKWRLVTRLLGMGPVRLRATRVSPDLP